MKKNVALMIPTRNPQIDWDKNEKIVLRIKRENKIDKIANKLFRTPLILTIELDEIGSFVWSNCDGKRNVNEIAENLKSYFGEAIEPVYERLLKYLNILINNKFIKLE